MNLNAIAALAQSRKAWVLLIAVAGVVAMNYLGRIDGPKALDFIGTLVAVWMGAQSLEDAAKKWAEGKGTVVGTVVGKLLSTKVAKEEAPAPALDP